MFITQPDHEFLLPIEPGVAGSRHWRAVRLSMHAVWFVLTVEVPDGEVSFVRTICIAWDTDLVDVLESLGDAKAVGLLCMTPGWCSPTGQWSARDVREVWVASASIGRAVILRDADGNEFGDQSRTVSSRELSDRRLILRLESSCGRRAGAEPCNPTVGKPGQVLSEQAQ